MTGKLNLRSASPELSGVENPPHGKSQCPWCLVLCTKLSLCDSCTHDASRRGAAGDDVASLIHNLRATPLLVCERLHLVLPLLPLDKLYICCCPTSSILPCKEVNRKRITMETCQGNELPAKTQLGKVPDEGLHLCICHARCIPVEGWAEVVSQHLVRHFCLHLGCELCSLGQNGLARFHPDGVSIRSEGDSPLDAKVSGTFDAEISLNRASRIPVEMDVPCTHGCGSLLHIIEGHREAVLKPLAWVSALGLQDLGNSIRISHGTSTLLPVLVSTLADCLIERLNAWHCRTLDVWMVNRINVRVDHCGCFSIRTSNQYH